MGAETRDHGLGGRRNVQALTVNAAAYYEKWNGVQQTNSLSSCGYVYTANAGDALASEAFPAGQPGALLAEQLDLGR